MATMTEEQQWLLERVKDNFGQHGIPAADTLREASPDDQQAVRAAINAQANGVRS